MSLINRLQGTKSSSFKEINCKKAGRGSPSASIPKQEEDNHIDGASLFSGMTISSALSSQSDEGLLESASSTPTKQQPYSQHVASDMQHMPAVLDTQESKFLPDPMLPIPVIIPEGPSLGKKKIKKHGNVVRPGYARQSEQNQTRERIDVEAFNTVEEEDNYTVEPKPMTCTTSSESNMAHNVPHSTPLVYETPHPTPLYSIGTPSSSDENLFEKDSLLEKDTSSEIYQENTETEKPEDQYTAADNYLEINVQSEQVIEPSEVSLVETEQETPDTIKNDEMAICSDKSPAAVTQATVRDTMISSGSTVEGKKDEYVEISEEAQKDTDLSKFCYSDLDKIQDITDPSSGVFGNQRLGILLQHKELQLAALSENKKSLADIEKELVTMYGRSPVAHLSTEQQIKELQLKENQALASDNYDLAEEISHQIEQLQQDLDSARYKIPATDRKVKEALKLREEIAEKEVEIYRENLASLQQLTERQQASLVRHQAASAAWNIKEKQLLNSERQRLERAMGHLKLDQEHLEKESSALQSEILVRTKEFHERKEGLIKQKELLQEEISSLEMKLAELKLREAEFSYAIEQEENNIEIAKTQFGPQQKMLDKQILDIEGRQKTLDHEFELLASAQEKFDDEVEDQNLKEQELAEVFAIASGEVKKFAEVISANEKQLRRIQQFLSMEHFTLETNVELASLHTEQKEVSQEIKRLTDKVQQVQRGVGTIKKALNEIETQVSDVDAAKEIAKQERNFREAKRLKEEREFLTKEGVRNQTQLESMLEELTDNKKLLEKARRKGEDLDLEINEYERSSALSKVEKASTVVQSLQHQIHRLRGDALVTTLLEAEVEACRNLIADLCDKHNILKPDVDGMQDSSYGDNSASEETPSYNKEEAELTKEYEHLIDELNELEGRLEAVVDVEDFNEAERLQQEIDKLNERIKRVAPVE